MKLCGGYVVSDIHGSNTVSNMLENICQNIIEMMILGEVTLLMAMTMTGKSLSNYLFALSELLVHFLTHYIIIPYIIMVFLFGFLNCYLSIYILIFFFISCTTFSSFLLNV